MRSSILGLACVAAFLGLGVAKAGAPPPSVVVEGAISVREPCVVFGQRIGFDGEGFAPRTPVHVYLSSGRYSLPGTETEMTIRSSVGGKVHGSLPTPEAGGDGDKWEWIQRAVFAYGLNRGGEHDGRSFDLVVVASRSVCRTLGRQAS
jgi:hypothetical protein